MATFTLTILPSSSLKKIVEKISSALGAKLNSDYFTRQEVDGGVFVSDIKGGYVTAAYYHPSKSHSATAVGGVGGGGTVKCTAGAGKWAVACSKAGIGLRRTYYDFS